MQRNIATKLVDIAADTTKVILKKDDKLTSLAGLEVATMLTNCNIYKCKQI